MGKTLRIPVGEKIQHGGIAGENQTIHLISGQICFLAGGMKQSFNGIRNLLLQFQLLAVHGGADASHHIGGDAGLGIQHSGFRQQFTGSKLIELQSQSGGSNVHGRAQQTGHGI